MLIKIFNNNFYLAAFVVSIIVGLEFPDIDFLIPFIGHRSFLTHSIIIPLIIYYYFFKRKKINLITNYFYSGFLIGISIHLCADLFPKAWIGFATIKVPYFLSIGPILSPIWMIVNLSLGFHLALKKIYELELKLSFKNKFIICTIGIIYFLSEYNPLTKIIVFLIFTFVIVKYINFLKKENLKN